MVQLTKQWIVMSSDFYLLRQKTGVKLGSEVYQKRQPIQSDWLMQVRSKDSVLIVDDILAGSVWG